MTAGSRQETVRWGIVGAGRVARAFGEDIGAAPGNRVEAVAARDPQRAAAFGAAIGARRVSPSYQALFQDPDVDVVYIATVHTVHREQALLALASGKNVVVEKPLAVTAAEAQEIADAARAAGRFCMEAMWMRMHPLVRRAHELVSGGLLGEVLGVRAELSGTRPYLPADRLFDPGVAGGALLDLGVYTAHFAWLFLGAPEGISAAMSYAPNRVDDGVAMQWAYPSGQFAQLFSSFRGPSALAGVVSGSEGFLQLGPQLNRPGWLRVQADGTEQVRETADSPGNGFGFEIAEVARCLRLGRIESPLAPLADSVGVLEALDRARSAVPRSGLSSSATQATA